MTGFRVVNEALFVIQTIQFGGKCSNFGGRIGSLSFKSPSSKLESRTSCQQPCTMQSPDFLLVNQHSSVFGVKIYTFWPILMPKSRADLFYSLEEAKLRRQRRCSCMFWGTPSQLPWSIRFCKSNGYFGKWEFEDKPNLVGKPMKNRGHTHTHPVKGTGIFHDFWRADKRRASTPPCPILTQADLVSQLDSKILHITGSASPWAL